MKGLQSLFIIILFSSATINSFACICWFSTTEKSIKRKIAEADAILYVVAMPDLMLSEKFQPSDSVLHISNISFKILQNWKGEKRTIVRLKAKKFPCGDASYIIGERYILFGYINKETGELETNDCLSLSENSVPDPLDRTLKNSEYYDPEGYRNARLIMCKEFAYVKTLINRQSR